MAPARPTRNPARGVKPPPAIRAGVARGFGVSAFDRGHAVEADARARLGERARRREQDGEQQSVAQRCGAT
jgi:hypothetical protein